MLLLLSILFTFGRFQGAADVDYDILGNIYVVDRAGNALVKYSPTGDSIAAVSGFGNGPLQFDEPVAVCARGGNDVYVADFNNHRIMRFNRTLDLVAIISTRDHADERQRFGYPRDVNVTRQGDLLIVDGENGRIVRVDALGQASSLGDIRSGPGRMANPMQVEIDAEDNVYVLDGNAVVQYDVFGTFVRRLPIADDGAGLPSGISVDRDTLTVLCGRTVRMYDLRGASDLGAMDLPAQANAVRYVGGRFLAVENKRGVVIGE